MNRAATWIAAIAIAAGALDAQPVRSPGELALYEVRIGRLRPFVLAIAIDSAGELAIPLVPVFEAAGIVRVVERARVSATEAQLAEILDARVAVDPATLSITIRRTTPFPAERAADRVAERERAERADAQSVLQVPRWTPRTGGPLVDWRVIAAPTEVGTSLFAASRVGVAVAGGDLSLGGYTQRAALGGTQTWGDWNYTFVNPASPWFRELRVGNLLGTNSTGQSLRGIGITNRRPFRYGYFDEVSFSPTVPGGWSYDIYQSGRLIDFIDEGLVARPTRIAVAYGTTPVEVHAYGPAGQLRVEPVVLFVPSSQLPRGRIEYDVAGGSCELAYCRRLAYASVDAGLTGNLTVGLGAQVLEDSVRTRTTPLAHLNFASLNGWRVQGDYQSHILERLRVSYAGVQRVAASVEGGRTYETFDAWRLVSTTRDRWFGAMSVSGRLATARGSWLPSVVLVNGSAAGDSGAVDSWNASGEIVMRGSSIGVFHASDLVFAENSTSLRATVIRPWQRNALSRLSVVTAGIGVAAGGSRYVELGANLELQQSGTISVMGRAVSRGPAPSVITITYAVLLDAARVAIQAQRAGTLSATVFDIGSAVALDPSVRPMWAATAGRQSAGAVGTAYYDENDNGVFDAGDRAADRVRISVGSLQATTDGSGRFRAWGLTPYEPIVVVADSIHDVQPEYSQRVTAPERATPNVFNPVEVRLVRTYEVAGRVELDSAQAPGGIRVILDDPPAGLRYETLTFIDGTFAFDRVFRGSYRVSVGEASQSALGASAAAVQVAVPGTKPVALRLVTKR
jgi:hypothetical protein